MWQGLSPPHKCTEIAACHLVSPPTFRDHSVARSDKWRSLAQEDGWLDSR